MARTRNLKPGFFKNEQLAGCQPLARLLFAGLWCLADRNGYLEDRPMRIKAELLPFDDVDCHALLAELADRDLVRRFTEGGRRLIHVPTFRLHQRPHAKEPAIFDQSGGAPAACARTENFNRKPGQVAAGGGQPAKPAELNGKPGKFQAAPRAEPGIGSDSVPLQPLQNVDQSAPYSLIASNPHSFPPNPPEGGGDMDARPEGLAQWWVELLTRRNARGYKAETVEQMTPEFAELLRLGFPPGRILDAIQDPARDRGEHFWRFKDRLKGGPVSAKPSLAEQGKAVWNEFLAKHGGKDGQP